METDCGMNYHLPCAIKARALANKFTRDYEYCTPEKVHHAISFHATHASSPLFAKRTVLSCLYLETPGFSFSFDFHCKQDCSRCEEGGAGVRCIKRDCVMTDLPCAVLGVTGELIRQGPSLHCTRKTVVHHTIPFHVSTILAEQKWWIAVNVSKWLELDKQNLVGLKFYITHFSCQNPSTV